MQALTGYQVLNVLKQIEEGRRRETKEGERGRGREERLLSEECSLGLPVPLRRSLTIDLDRERERESVCVCVIIGIIVARDARLVVGVRTSHGAALRLCAVLCCVDTEVVAWPRREGMLEE